MSIKVTVKRGPVVIQIGEQTLEISHSDALKLWNSLGRALGKLEDPLDRFRWQVMPAKQWNSPEPRWGDKNVVYLGGGTVV